MLLLYMVVNSVYVCVCSCLRAEEVAGLQSMKRILGKVQEMRDQRCSLEKQLRDLIQQDDITSALVTTERADMKVHFLLASSMTHHYKVQGINLNWGKNALIVLRFH